MDGHWSTFRKTVTGVLDLRWTFSPSGASSTKLGTTRNSFFFTGAILLGQSQGFVMQVLRIHFKGMAAQFEAVKMQALAERHEQVYWKRSSPKTMTVWVEKAWGPCLGSKRRVASACCTVLCTSRNGFAHNEGACSRPDQGPVHDWFLGFAVIFTKYFFHWVLNPPKINPLIRFFWGGQPLLTNSFGMQVLRHQQTVPAPEPRCYDERDEAASRET